MDPIQNNYHTGKSMRFKFNIICLSSILLFLLACQNNTQNQSSPSSANTTDTSSVASPYDSAQITIETFKKKGGWGYDIYIDTQRYIHQPHIPAVAGYIRFKSKADAKKAGQLVKQKIKQGILPPSVTPQELDSLGVLPAP